MSYISEEQVKEFLINLTKYNSEKEFSSLDNIKLIGDRVEYSVILKYIQYIDSEEKDSLIENAIQYKNSKKLNENVMKIIDYVLLEIPRAKDQERLKNQIIRANELLRNLSIKDKEYEKNMEEHKSQMSRMQGEFISILSIFSAVIIAFFGGISVLGSCLNNINKASSYKIFFMILIIGFIMFNVIYMLLYSVSRITKKDIDIKIQLPKCSSCKNPYFFKCIMVRYPVVFLYNFITLLLGIILYLMYLVDKYNIISTIIFKISSKLKLEINKSYIPIIGIVFLIIIWFIDKRNIKKRFHESILDCDKVTH